MTTWKAFAGWWRRRWQWVVAGLGVVFGVMVSLMLRRPARAREVVVPPPVDPSAALPPLRDIGPQAEKIKDAVHADAGKDAEEAKDAHAAIDAADSIDAVNDVLYGKHKPG
jgi:hypothetical protein